MNNQPQIETEANEESDDANSMIKGSQESTNTLEEIVKFIEATKESDEDSFLLQHHLLHCTTNSRPKLLMKWMETYFLTENPLLALRKRI